MIYESNYEKLFKPDKRLYWAMDDKGVKKGFARIPKYDLCIDACLEGYGVFHSVQSFKSIVRKEAELSNIDFWAIDLDGGNKSEQEKIIKDNIRPSYVVETKNGYHVYFKTINASIKYFKEIMKRLIKGYNADPQAKDYSRVLRVPDYNHYKGDNPFMCKEVYFSDISYSDKNMLNLTQQWATFDNQDVAYKKDFSWDGKIYNPKYNLSEGERNHNINRIAYIWRTKNKLSMPEIEQKVNEYNTTKVQPPLNSSEIKQILRSIARV